MKVPQSAAPSPTEVKTAAQSGAVPPHCPKCGGQVWDNRDNKKNPKAPDWKCRDKKCVDDKGFVTAGWMKPAGKANAYAGKNNDASSYEQPPVALADDGPDDLPF